MQLENIGFAGLRLIEAYGDMGFRFTDGRHEGSVLILPERIEGFAASSMSEVDLESFGSVIAEQANIEILLFGTGEKQHFPSQDIMKYFIEQKIALEVMDSRAACRTYNILASEDRKVAAAIIAVD
ncbi:MAG: Mth938-like domain-containing protein [Hyphomicrobiaceae bacterium]|nr:Mth938-like domain-containing protein [Hyphomicrobiaceae bacterium]